MVASSPLRKYSSLEPGERVCTVYIDLKHVNSIVSYPFHVGVKLRGILCMGLMISFCVSETGATCVFEPLRPFCTLYGPPFWMS